MACTWIEGTAAAAGSATQWDQSLQLTYVVLGYGISHPLYIEDQNKKSASYSILVTPSLYTEGSRHSPLIGFKGKRPRQALIGRAWTVKIVMPITDDRLTRRHLN